MGKFSHPIEDSSVKPGHYLLGLIIILVSMIFLSSILVQGFNLTTDVQEFTKNTMLIVSLIPFLIGVLACWVVAQVILKRSLFSLVTARPNFDFKRFFFAFSCWFVLLVISFSLAYYQNPTAFSWNFDGANFAFLVIISVLLIPIQTGFEEIFFRGFLLQFFGKFLSKGIWIVLSSGLVFGLLHSLNPEVSHLGIAALIFYIISGVFTALLTILDDGLELPWGFHLGNNLFNILIVSNNWQVLQTDALFLDHTKPKVGIELVVTIGVFYPLLLLVFHCIYKWGNWKKKLFNE